MLVINAGAAAKAMVIGKMTNKTAYSSFGNRTPQSSVEYTWNDSKNSNSPPNACVSAEGLHQHVGLAASSPPKD